jgi:hypothetical protein
MPRQFTPNRLHDASGIVRRATPVADVVNSRSSGTAISSARADSLRDIVLPFIRFGPRSREQGPRHDGALDLVDAFVDLGDLGSRIMRSAGKSWV